MSLDPHSVEIWLFSQLGLFAVYLVKELWRIFRDQGKQNSEDIGAMKLKLAKAEADLNAVFEKVRTLESSLRSGSPSTGTKSVPPPET